MVPKTPQTRVLFRRCPMLAGFGVFVLSVVVCTLFVATKPTLAAASTTVNFQARLMNANGAIVPDGYYNVEFNLYNTKTLGTPLWTEDYTSTSGPSGSDVRVQVVDGYLTVSLGSITAFSPTIDWSQSLYLTMNIGGDSGTPSWDGEMNPRLLLTAVPYAFAAHQATQLASGTSSLMFDSTSGDAITLPNASGEVCLETATACGFAPGTSASYIQNGTGLQSAANFNISGSGTAATSLLTPTVDVASAGTLSLGVSTATAITIGKTGVATTVAGTLGVTGNATFSGALVVGTGSASGTNSAVIGTGTAAGNDSLAVGASASSHGADSLAVGSGATAQGTASVAFGNDAFAYGDYTFAFGLQSESDTPYSAALGSYTHATGSNTLAVGDTTTAQAYDSITGGRCNIAQGSTSSWVSTDSLLTLGNGSGPQAGSTFACSTYSNAFQVLKNGNTTVGGTLTVTNSASAASLLSPSLDAASGTLSLGTSTASAVTIGKVGVATTVAGTLGVTGNATFSGTVGVTSSVTAGSLIAPSLDAASGTLSLGTGTASAVTIGSSSISTTNAGKLFVGSKLYAGLTTDPGGVTGAITVEPTTTSTVGLVVRGLSGQSVDLLQAQNSSGSCLWRVNTTGTTGSCDDTNASGGSATTATKSGDVSSTATGDSGAVTVRSGNNSVSSGNTGLVTIKSGDASGTSGASGQVQIYSGSAASGITTGAVGISTGNALGGSAGSGALSLVTGNVTSGSGVSGGVTIDVGTSTGSTGTVSIGAVSASTVTIGNTTGSSTLNLESGTGNINLKSSGSVIVRPTADSSAAFLIKNSAGTTNLFVADTADGIVGIGMAPSTGGSDATLQIAGSADVVGRVLQVGPTSYAAPITLGGPSSAYVVLDKIATGSDASVLLRDQGNTKAEIGLSTDDDIHFKTVTGTDPSDTFTDRMIIFGTGSTVGTPGDIEITSSLGIGTASPQNLLHLAGNNSASRLGIKIENDGSTAGATAIQFAGLNNNWLMGTDAGLNGGNNFFIQDNNAGYPPRLLINSAGDVAIGKDSASYNLDVVGDINTSTVYRIGGNVALQTIGTGASTNVLVGGAGNGTLTGTANVALGNGALAGDTTGSDNFALGTNSGLANTTGSNNVSIGINALESNTTGDGNIIIGNTTGTNLTSGNTNLIIGYNISAPTATTSSFLDVGNVLYGNTSTGSAYFKPTASNDSTTAFQIENSTGTIALLDADTTNMRINIGGGSAGTSTPTLLVLSNKNTTGDPTEVDGAIYYNSVSKSFRCGENTVWRSCLGGLAFSNTAPSSAISYTTTETDFTTDTASHSLGYTILPNDCQPGAVYRVTAMGTYTTAAAATLKFSVDMNSTSTTLATMPGASTISAAETSGWVVNFDLICDTTGSPGSVDAQGTSVVYTTTGGNPWSMSNTSTQNFTTASSNTLYIGFKWGGTSNAGDNVTLHQMLVERLGP